MLNTLLPQLHFFQIVVDATPTFLYLFLFSRVFQSKPTLDSTSGTGRSAARSTEAKTSTSQSTLPPSTMISQKRGNKEVNGLLPISTARSQQTIASSDIELEKRSSENDSQITTSNGESSEGEYESSTPSSSSEEDSSETEGESISLSDSPSEIETQGSNSEEIRQ